MLVRTRPFNPVFDRRFDRAFDQLANSFVSGPTAARRAPVVDASWSDGSLVLTVDLPGTPGDAVGVSVAGRTLTLSATTPDQSWERSVRLGAALDPDQVSATYLDGRLTVTVGAVVAAEPRRIEVATTPAVTIEVEADETSDQPENGTSDTA